MSASDQGAPTPSLADAFAALDTQDTGPVAAPETAAPQPGAGQPQPTDAAPQTPAAEAPAPAQQPGESNVDYAARVTELERQVAERDQQIQNREWSSQGRYLQEKAKREAAETRIKELEEGFTAEDSYRKGLYDRAIAQAETPEQATLLTQQRDLELRERAFTRQQQQEAAARKVQEAETEASQQITVAQHERTVRTEALPELLRTIDTVAKDYDLPEEEVRALRRMIDTPANRMLVQSAPPKFIGAFVLQQMQYLDQEARAAQGRVVARNREAAASAGTYRGAVDTATAPAPQTIKRDPAQKDVDQLAGYFGARQG